MDDALLIEPTSVESAGGRLEGNIGLVRVFEFELDAECGCSVGVDSWRDAFGTCDGSAGERAKEPTAGHKQHFQ